MCFDFTTQEISLNWQGKKVTLQQSTKLADNIVVVFNMEKLGKVGENACFLVQLSAIEAVPSTKENPSAIPPTINLLLMNFLWYSLLL